MIKVPLQIQTQVGMGSDSSSPATEFHMSSIVKPSTQLAEPVFKVTYLGKGVNPSQGHSDIPKSAHAVFPISCLARQCRALSLSEIKQSLRVLLALLFSLELLGSGEASLHQSCQLKRHRQVKSEWWCIFSSSWSLLTVKIMAP